VAALTASARQPISAAKFEAREDPRARPLFSEENRKRMANTSSAKKATRKIARRAVSNGNRISRVRSYVRKVDEAIASGDKAAAAAALMAAQPELMRAASKGVIPKKTASRKVSRLAARVKAVGT
jgi:small subunit ribosomal protein S20